MSWTRLKRWWPIPAAILAAVVLGGTIRAYYNTERLNKLIAAEKLEQRRDDRRAREADARMCARDNRERAEFQVTYSKFELKQELARVQRNLPVLYCDANLKGKQPTERRAEAQERFVCLYRESQLKPLPTAEQIKGKEPDPQKRCE